MNAISKVDYHRQATDAAGQCRELVLKTAAKIQGRRYVQVEGWQAIANSFGCVASAYAVEVVEGGIRATGQVRRIEDGLVIAEAEGFVGDDETTWQKRPMFARRAMAQTRAISRACRSAFAFIVPMLDAGLETTPAEEMSHYAELADQEPPRAPLRIPPKPSVADDAAMQKARAAIDSAKSAEQLRKFAGAVRQRIDDGFYLEDQAAELFEMLDERLSIMEEVTQ